MSQAVRRVVIAALWCLVVCPRAQAGMPSVTLADVKRELSLSNLTRLRLESISFFLLALMICAGVIQFLWNWLRKDFPILPRLSYPRACGLLVLWGFLFVLVLTMISGARELLTPGAWEKKGWTYELAEETSIERQISERVRNLERLHAEAEAQSGTPSSAALAEVPGFPGAHYRVVESRRLGDDERLGLVLVYEPEAVGTDRLVLLTNGLIQWMPATELERRLREEAP